MEPWRSLSTSIERNPAKARVVKVPAEKSGRVVAWSDEIVFRIVECHPPLYRPIASIGAASGLRQGELFGLAEEDVDFDEMVIHVRRQVKKLGSDFAFALPKNDTERTVPQSDGTALILKQHIESTTTRAVHPAVGETRREASVGKTRVPVDG